MQLNRGSTYLNAALAGMLALMGPSPAVASFASLDRLPEGSDVTPLKEAPHDELIGTTPH